MIDIYTGTPGSGKSLHCAMAIKEHIGKRGKPVVTNFMFHGMACNPVKYGGHVYLENQRLKPQVLYKISDIYKKKCGFARVPEEDILLCIDEAQIIFNARAWQTGDNRVAWNEFFTQHRKLGYHVILIAQYMDMIDKQMRAVIEYEYIHRKIGNIGRGGKVLSGVMGGGMHIYVQYYAPLKIKVGSRFFRPTKDIYDLYDSYGVFRNIEGAYAKF